MVQRPALSGVCLRIRTDFSQTRARVPIAEQPSIRCSPVIAGTMELVKRYRTIYKRYQKRIALAQEVYPSAVTETSSV